MNALPSEKMLPKEVEDRLFMTPKAFAKRFGVSYGLVLDWIRQGIPCVPGRRSPHIIIVPAAMDWFKKRFGF